MLSVIFFNGTFVNTNSTSKGTKLSTSNDIEFFLTAPSKESWTTYSYCANEFNNDAKNFPLPWCDNARL